MTLQDGKPYYSPRVRLTSATYDAGTKKYSGSVETTYLGTLDFTLEMLDMKKTTANGYVIVWELFVDGQQIAIFENDYNGNKSWSGTLARNADGKGVAWMKISKIMSADPIKQFEIQVSEKPQDVKSKDPEVRAAELDLPFK